MDTNRVRGGEDRAGIRSLGVCCVITSSGIGMQIDMERWHTQIEASYFLRRHKSTWEDLSLVSPAELILQNSASPLEQTVFEQFRPSAQQASHRSLRRSH